MKAIVNRDQRCEIDRRFDDCYNKMIRKARLTPQQINVVSAYMREIMEMRIHEIRGAVDISWILSLIEGEGYGTDPRRGAFRLQRAHKKAVDIRDEAFSQGSVDARGFWNSYDGCGYERLQARLARYGCEYEDDVRVRNDTSRSKKTS